MTLDHFEILAAGFTVNQEKNSRTVRSYNSVQESV